MWAMLGAVLVWLKRIDDRRRSRAVHAGISALRPLGISAAMWGVVRACTMVALVAFSLAQFLGKPSSTLSNSCESTVKELGPMASSIASYMPVGWFFPLLDWYLVASIAMVLVYGVTRVAQVANS